MDDTSNEVNSVPNSDVIKHTLFSLISVARSKTSKDYAYTMAKNLLTELKENFSFLGYIHINNIDTSCDSIDDISVISDFDNIDSKHIGEAIQSIVDLYKTRLGNKAGYFFLTEFKRVLGEEYYSIIKKMGVDLRLIDLQKEIAGIDTVDYKIRDKIDSNIAYLEKIE
jgi:hypothetical protein